VAILRVEHPQEDSQGTVSPEARRAQAMSQLLHFFSPDMRLRSTRLKEAANKPLTGTVFDFGRMIGMMRKYLTAAALFAAALAAASCSDKKPAPDLTPVVVVAHPVEKEITDWDDYVGHFEAVDSVDIRPRVSGYLQSVNFRDGDFVQKGQLLFVIDPRPYQASLDQAKAQVARASASAAVAKAEQARAQSLFTAKAVSQQEVMARDAAAGQANADLAAAQALQRTAQLNLSFTRVTAPMGGRISDRRVAPGNLVNADSTVLTSLVNLNPIRFVFSGAEGVYLKYQRANENGTRASSRRKPNPVSIRLQDEPDYRWKGHMDFVDNAIDTNSGTIRGRAVIDNPDNFLTPGMFGHLRLLGSGAYKGVLAPDQAVVTDQSRQVVYVVGTDNTVSQRLVETGPLVDGLRVIRKGLSASDQIVIDGVQRAKPGKKVKPKPGVITPASAQSAPTKPLVDTPSRSATAR
jgi:RND family efflux transporter MFP subunit